MKVLIVHCSYKFRGGEDTVVSEEIKLLKTNGITVELLEFNNNKNSILKILQLPFNVNSYVKTRRKLNAFQADVVHIHNLHYAGTASIIYAVKKSKVPFVVTLHNFRLLCPSATLFWEGKLYLDSLKQKFPWNAVTKGVYKNSKLLTFWVCLSNRIHQRIGTWKMCDRYIVLSQHSKKLFARSHLDFMNGKLTVKPNFCSAPLLAKPLIPEYFLYMGRLTEEKGVLLLLKVFSSGGYKIKITGDGPLRNEVISYSSRFSNIEFLHEVKKDDVFTLLSNCSALIFPSIWYEGMPLTIIEAFACGTPVIASELGVMESMITHHFNGLHFEPGSENDLKNKIEEWQELKEEQKKKYRDRARETYEQHYTPQKNFKQLISIYNDVIEEKAMTATR